MLFFRERALFPFNIFLCCSVSFLLVRSETNEDGEFTAPHVSTVFTTTSSGSDKLRSSEKFTDKMMNDAPKPDDDLVSKSSLLIESIVEQTVLKYLEMIRTRPDWLRRLLQLVREERDIRSKYSCSTDTCIYKIQFFKHAFSKSALLQKRNEFNVMLKRSSRSADSIQPKIDLGETAAEQLESVIDKPNLKANENGHKEVIKGEGADALRLPEPPISTTQSDRTRVALAPEMVEFQERMGGVIGKNNHAQRDPSITKAFYKQLKRPIADESDDDEPFPNKIEDPPYLDPTKPQETGQKRQPAAEVTTPTPAKSEETTTVQPVQTGGDKAEQSREDELLDQRETRRLRIEIDASSVAIPFGMRSHYGQPSEECVGRYAHYCFNAVKCLYISVLETAICYCETGYTGVRCEMFNLPEALERFKLYKDTIVDIEKLDATSASSLYNAVEATARYTVNAALEDDRLVTWTEDMY